MVIAKGWPPAVLIRWPAPLLALAQGDGAVACHRQGVDPGVAVAGEDAFTLEPVALGPEDHVDAWATRDLQDGPVGSAGLDRRGGQGAADHVGLVGLLEHCQSAGTGNPERLAP